MSAPESITSAGEWLALDLVRTHLAARSADEEPFRRRLAKLAALE